MYELIYCGIFTAGVILGIILAVVYFGGGDDDNYRLG